MENPVSDLFEEKGLNYDVRVLLSVIVDSKVQHDAVFLDGLAIRQLRGWVDEMLRTQDCSAAHRLLSALNGAMHEQAVKKGRQDAWLFDEPRLSQHAQPLWKSGYEEGWAIEKSRKAGEL